ncbi:MAG: hypothetical protein L0226_16275 [Acidobacteria bacterium]|nr:hypothetical protein [Acidobacteriota bacterium]
MAEIDFELAHFFAWARLRAYREFDERMKADPQLDPNWTFSEIMQELLNEYRRLHAHQLQADTSSTQNSDE